MTKIEKAQQALKNAGVTTAATKWETLVVKLKECGLNPETFVDDPAISDELLKLIKDDPKGKSFDSPELQQELKDDKEREYPDFGREIPEGTYEITGYSTIHEWKSPRTGATSKIRTAFLNTVNPKTGRPYELPFSCFSKNEYKFVPADGTEKFYPNTPLPHYDSTADRNLAVTKFAPLTKVKVCHKRGHHDNPYAKRVFDFVYTWCELA